MPAGRPEKFPIKKVIGFDQPMIDAIDAYREAQETPLNASDAIRLIIADWLARRGYLKKQK